MTTVDPEDVVLYDIDTSKSLEELYADPETQWFAIKRIAQEALRGDAGWNPLLHPRGRDGKFIEKFGWVRWFDFDSGKWLTGKVWNIDSAGTLQVTPKGGGDGDVFFSHTEVREKLQTIAAPKGRLKLPNPTNPDAEVPGWKKVGGQGGSNPGGLYEIDNEMPLSGSQVTEIMQAHGLANLTTDADENWVPGIYRDPKTGRMYRAYSSSSIVSLDGSAEPEKPGAGWDLYVANIGHDNDVDEAWFNLKQVYADHAIGERFYVKKAKSISHAANELLANRMYELAGVPVAETARGADPQMISSKLVNSTEDDKVDLSAAVSGNWGPQLAQVREDMVVDAWLANWDVVGLGLENVQVIDGVPYRIDAGGALYYRAQGAPKGHLFGPTVGEIDTLRNPQMNHQSAKVFGPTTEEELLKGALKVASVNPADIIALVDATEGAPPDLADTLIARRQYIIDKFELDDPWLLPPDMVPMDASVPNTDVAPDDAEPVPYVDLGVPEDPNELVVGGTYLSLFQSTSTGAVEMTDAEIMDIENGKALVEWKSSWSSTNSQRWVPLTHLFTNVDDAMAHQAQPDVTGDKTNPDVGTPEAVVGPTTSLAGSKHWSVEEETWKDGVLSNSANNLFMIIEEALENDEGQWINGDELTVDKVIVHDGSFWKATSKNKYAPDGPNIILEPLTPLKDTKKVPLGADYWTINGTLGEDLAITYNAMMNASITADVADVGDHHGLIQNPLDPGPMPDGMVGWEKVDTDVVYLSSFTAPVGGSSWMLHDPNALQVGDLVWHNGQVKTVAEPFPADGFQLLALTPPGGYPQKIDANTQADPDLDIYVAKNGYAKSLFKAIHAAHSFEADNEEISDTPTPVDEALIKSLDQKAATAKLAEEVAPPVPEVDEPGDDAYIPWNDAYDSIQPYNNGQAVEPGQAAAWDTAFMTAFGGLGAEGVSVKDFEDWVDAQEGLNKEAVGAWLLSEKGVETTLGGPTVPQVIPGISDKLNVGKTINFSKYGTDGNDLVAESLVGKVLFAKYADPDKQDVSVGDKLWYYGAGTQNGIYGLFYIESFDPSTGVLKGRTAKGSAIALKTKGAYNNVYDLHDVSASVSVDDLKSMTGPTKKQNGDLVVNGHVVGKWSKADTWHTAYDYEIFPEFSSTGLGVKGIAKSQNNIAKYASLNIIPLPAAPTKKKTASKEYAAVKEMVSKDIPGDPTLSNGEPAKLGDWVQATKGGGGFVGKIVGWPNQETHPGLAFAVSDEGIQKIVKLKTQKKVDGPDSGGDLPGLDGDLPSAYTGISLADGKVPKVGQRVKAGAAGSEIEGIITNINLEQGWVYILTDDGKKKSKTFSVTTVLEEPNLIWDPEIPTVAKAAALKPKAKSGKKKGQASYPAPDGSLIDQPQADKDAWLAGHPKRKLTKDGYAPKIGMRVRLKGGVEATIVKINGDWESNPNGLRVFIASEGKVKVASTSTVEVDHANELLGFAGEPPAKIHSIQLAGNGEASLPNGTQIFAHNQTVSWYSWAKSKTRSADTVMFLAVLPDGTAQKFYSPGAAGYTNVGGWGSFMNAVKSWGDKPQTNLEHVGTIDSSADPTAVFKISAHKLNPNGAGGEKELVPATWGWVNNDGVETPEKPKGLSLTPDQAIKDQQEALDKLIAEEEAIEQANQANTSLPDVDPDDVQTTSEGGSNAPEPEPVSIPDEEPEPAEPAVFYDAEGNVVAQAPDTLTPPEIIPSNSLTGLTPPPAPKTSGEPAVTYPAIPVATQTPATAYKMDGKPSWAPQVNSIREAGLKQIAHKDSTDAGTGHTYALGDSDLVEDMAFRYHVESVDGQERLVLRFRLREDMSEEQLAKMMVVAGGKKGNWKTQGTKYPTDFVVGDAVAVRVGTNQAGTYGDPNFQMLKPHDKDASVAPNARVIAPPKYIGKTGGAAGEFDTFRVRIRTEQGLEGDVDIQMRLEGSVTTFEWDHDAPAPASGANLSLTPTASEAGWVKTGSMTMLKRTGTNPESPGGGADLTNDQGKFVRESATTTFISTMAKGTGGSRLTRKESDGSEIIFNSAHSTEGGTGNDTTRRANLSGTVEIAVPLDGRPEDEILGIMSKNMELVGLEPSAQTPPSDAQVVNWALAKFVANYHPTFHYRGKPITGPDDKRVAETLQYMNTELGKYMDREITLADIRLHQHENGRLQVVLHPDVGKAIAKRQGIKVMDHSGVDQARVMSIFGGPNSGLLSSDERYSLGITKSGQSSHTDMTIGSGDRVYMRGTTSPVTGHVFMNPAVIALGLEQYNNQYNSGDNYGRRGSQNFYMTSGTGKETMYKRAIDRTFIAGYTAGSDTEAEAIIKKLKSKGISHIGGRPVEEIILGPTQAKYKVSSGDWLDTGMEVFENDLPITELLGLTSGAALVVGGTVYTNQGAEFVLMNGASE